MCYTGVAASTARCELCFATSHTERECAQCGDPNPGMKNRLKAIETAILAMSSKPPAAPKAANVAPCSQAHSGGLPKMEQRPLFLPTVPSHPRMQWLWGTSPSRSVSCLPTGSGSTPLELQSRWANISRLQQDHPSTKQQADTDGSRTSSIGVHQLLFCAVARLLMVVFLCTAVTGLC